jgi:hypothetical protein
MRRQRREKENAGPEMFRTGVMEEERLRRGACKPAPPPGSPMSSAIPTAKLICGKPLSFGVGTVPLKSLIRYPAHIPLSVWRRPALVEIADFFAIECRARATASESPNRLHSGGGFFSRLYCFSYRPRAGRDRNRLHGGGASPAAQARTDKTRHSGQRCQPDCS